MTHDHTRLTWLTNYHLKEGNSGVIELGEENEIHIQAMLEFLYAFNYDRAEKEGHSGKKCRSHTDTEAHVPGAPGCVLWPFGLSVAMYRIGDQYDIATLRNYASSRAHFMLTMSLSVGELVRLFLHLLLVQDMFNMLGIKKKSC